MEMVKLRRPAFTCSSWGHSAGGVVSCLYALERQSDLAELICKSFAFQVPAPDFIALYEGEFVSISGH